MCIAKGSVKRYCFKNCYKGILYSPRLNIIVVNEDFWAYIKGGLIIQAKIQYGHVDIYNCKLIINDSLAF